MPFVGLQCVIVAFSGHTNSFFICVGVGRSIHMLYASKESMDAYARLNLSWSLIVIMGLVARNPVFGVLRIAKSQTSLRIRAA